VEDDVKDDVIVATVSMVAVGCEVGGPNVELDVAAQKAAVLVGDDRVAEIRPGNGVAPSGMNDLQKVSLTRSQGFARETLPLPQVDQFFFAQAWLCRSGKFEDTSGGLVFLRLFGVFGPRLAQDG
jgi:hypothetical protein